MADPIEEERAVGQTGKPVVQTLVCETLLELAALAEVTHRDDPRRLTVAVGDGPGQDLDREGHAVGAQGERLDRLVGIRAGMLKKVLACLRCGELDERPADERRRVLAEQMPEGFVDLQDRALPVDGERLGGRVRKAPEAFLRLAQG